MKKWFSIHWCDIIFVLSILISSAILASAPVVAKPLAGDMPASCVVFAKAGVAPLYRCLDEDYGYVCFFNPSAAGMLFCLEY